MVALLPGSRGSEVERMLPVFLAAAAQALAMHSQPLHFVVPAANERRYQQIQQLLAAYPKLPVTLLNKQSQCLCWRVILW